MLYNVIQTIRGELMALIKPKTMIHHLPLTEVRNNLGRVIRRANINKEMFILEKGGIPVAALMNIDDLEDYIELQDPKMKKQISEGFREYLEGKARPVEELLAELKKEYAKPKRKKK
jgi:antitoxin (DNA-binding transcriptional repressor) of toxin-antitoxin stability system